MYVFCEALSLTGVDDDIQDVIFGIFRIIKYGDTEFAT